MTSRRRFDCVRRRTLDSRVACAVALFVMLPAGAWADEPCQNQAKIDACKLGCTVTGDVCGALCDVSSGACWAGCQVAFGACDAGCEACDIGCDVCCPTATCDCDSCRRDCNNCRTACDNARDDCEDGCQLDCDECIFDCERDCESICRPFKKIGESCAPLVDRCAEGLTCWPFLFQCFPAENEEIADDDECRSFYSSSVHEDAINGNVTWSFGTGAAAAVGISETLETGNVYGQDGSYGCYVTICLGGTIDVEVGSYVTTGIYTSYADFQGESVAFVEEAGEIIVFATAQIINTSGDLIGTADSLSFEASLAPITAGVYDCTTIVDTVGLRQPDGTLKPVGNSPPLALCADRAVCAHPETCVAGAFVAGSDDPDHDSLTVVQTPAEPFAVGTHDVTLTVTDPSGASDSCTATVRVDDCDPPTLTCPKSLTVECEANGETFVDPGFATVVECSEFTITEYEPDFFPLGTTTLTYEAVESEERTVTCEQTITVESEDSDGDGLVDCVDLCPNIRALSRDGCPGFDPAALDTDGDGVLDGVDACPGTAAGESVGPDGCLIDEPEPQPAPDADGDGVPDDVDACPDTSAGEPVDDTGCVPEPPAPMPADSDGDGVPDELDQCPETMATEVDDVGCPIDSDEGQPVPDDETEGEGPCGLIDLSSLVLLGLGLVGLRWMGAAPGRRARRLRRR